MTQYIDFFRIYDTIANFESRSTVKKIGIASDTNTQGFRPLMYNDGYTVNQCATIDEKAAFLETTISGDLLFPDNVGSGYYNNRIQFESNLPLSIGTAIIGAAVNTGFISQNLDQVGDMSFNYAENGYAQILEFNNDATLMYSVFASGVKGNSATNRNWILNINSSGFWYGTNIPPVSTTYMCATSTGLGIGRIASELLSINTPTDTLHITDCIEVEYDYVWHGENHEFDGYIIIKANSNTYWVPFFGPMG